MKTAKYSVRLGELYGPWRKYCKQVGIGPAEGIRQVIQKVLGGTNQVLRGEESANSKQVHSLRIYLTPDEYQKLTEVSKSYSVGKATRLAKSWVLEKLTNAPPVLKNEELDELIESNRIVIGVARNLNQIARALNGGESISSREINDLSMLAQGIREHLNHAYAFMRAREAG